MSKIRGYKKAENAATRSVKSFFIKICLSFKSACKAVSDCCRRKLTIMIVPHSQKKVFNFQTTVFSLCFFAVLIAGIFGAFFWYSKNAAISSVAMSDLQSESAVTRASLDQMRDETAELLKAAKNFQNAFSEALASLGIEQADNSANALQGGDLSAFFDAEDSAYGSLREAAELRHLTGYLNDSIAPIDEISKLIQSQNATFADIPNIWPLKHPIGHFSMKFGRNIHPITKIWYLHKGLDISTYRSGDPVVSTANGQVVSQEYDPSYGNTIVIKHKHGFYTRYAHLQSFAVSRGQFVKQGQTIGFIGNTGISTGPHLHYEVHLGSSVVDPMMYLNLKTTNISR